MGFTYKRGSKLIIDDGTNRYQVLVADFSFSETFTERGYSPSTVHNDIPIDNVTFTNSKSNATFEFEFYFGSSKEVEKKILDWYGFSNTGDTCSFPATRTSLQTNKYDVYIDMGDKVVLVDNCILENFSFTLNPRGILGGRVSGSGETTLTDGVSVPTNGTLYTQSGFTNSYLQVSINNNNIDNLRGVSLELTKQINWLNNQSVHDALSGTLYIPDTVIANNLAVSGSFTTTKIDSTEPTSLDLARVTVTVGDYMVINLENSNITERVSFDSGVLSLVTDYKLLDTEGSYIQF